MDVDFDDLANDTPDVEMPETAVNTVAKVLLP